MGRPTPGWADPAAVEQAAALQEVMVMSADVWLKRDIANALLAAYQAACETSCALGGTDPIRTASFHAGYRSALSTVALFFGIAPGLVIPDNKMVHISEDSGPGYRRLKP
jgi:hypothetical protein